MAGALVLLLALGAGGLTVWIFRASIFGEDPPPPPIVRPISDDPQPPPIPPFPAPAPIQDAGSGALAPEPPRLPDAGPSSPPIADPPAATPLAAARACAQAGDWRCVVRTLEGTARSEPELALLVDGYRRTGNSAAATRTMRRYLLNHPTGRRAIEYRRRLEGVGPR